MNELEVNSLNIAIAVASVAVFVIVLVAWFFLNRASVKANEQIALLTELLEQQKQQTELLAKLTRGDPPNPASTPVPGEPIMFKDFIAER